MKIIYRYSHLPLPQEVCVSNFLSIGINQRYMYLIFNTASYNFNACIIVCSV